MIRPGPPLLPADPKLSGGHGHGQRATGTRTLVPRCRDGRT